MSSPDPADKRRSTRVATLKMVVRIPSVDRLRTHYLKDISEGGLFVKAEKVLPVGALLALELWPPGWDKAVELGAKVVRSVDPETAKRDGVQGGMGVQFVNVTPDADLLLKSLVQSYQGADSKTLAEAVRKSPPGATGFFMLPIDLPSPEAKGKTPMPRPSGLTPRPGAPIAAPQTRPPEPASPAPPAPESGEVKALTEQVKTLTEQAQRLEREKEEIRSAAAQQLLASEREKDEAKSNADALAGQIQQLEREKEEARANVALLAQERVELNRKLDELGAMAANADALKEELEAARRELAQQREAARKQQESASGLAIELAERRAREEAVLRLLTGGAPRQADGLQAPARDGAPVPEVAKPAPPPLPPAVAVAAPPSVDVDIEIDFNDLEDENVELVDDDVDLSDAIEASFAEIEAGTKPARPPPPPEPGKTGR